MVREIVLSDSIADTFNIGDMKDALISCSNLVSVRIEHSSQISPLFGHLLSEHTPFLFRLELPGCTVSSNFVMTLIHGCGEMRHLDLSHTTVSLSVLAPIIESCKYLESLDLSGISQELEGIDFRSREPNLQRTFLKRIALSSTDTTDSIIGAITRICPNLTHLIVDSCAYITDHSAIYIAEHCMSIQMLSFSYCNITDQGLRSFAMVNRHFHQNSNPETKSVVSMYASQTTSSQKQMNFNELHLEGCYRITPKGLVNLASRVPSLAIIVLDGCNNILTWYNNFLNGWDSEADTDVDSSNSNDTQGEWFETLVVPAPAHSDSVLKMSAGDVLQCAHFHCMPLR